MKHIVVMGVLNRQRSRIEQWYKGKAAFTFSMSDGALLNQLPPKADVILMTKHLSHRQSSKVRHAHKVYYCNGGLSTLRQRIDALLLEGKHEHQKR